jgi:Mrp family chromosome partitioning ATPase
MSAEEAIVQPLEDIPFLHVLPPGILPPLPSAIFTAPEYMVLLDHLLEIYDYILVDTPPLIFASELMAIAKHVDGLVVNIRAGITTKGAFRELLDNLDIVGYQGSYYAKRYYEGHGISEGETEAEGKGKGRKHQKHSKKNTKVSRGYRYNFIKDLKLREKARGIGTISAMHPFIDKNDPFASTTPEKQRAQVVAPIEGAADFLEAVERDPRSSGRQ